METKNIAAQEPMIGEGVGFETYPSHYGLSGRHARPLQQRQAR